MWNIFKFSIIKAIPENVEVLAQLVLKHEWIRWIYVQVKHLATPNMKYLHHKSKIVQQQLWSGIRTSGIKANWQEIFKKKKKWSTKTSMQRLEEYQKKAHVSSL